jgi:serine protease AprX
MADQTGWTGAPTWWTAGDTGQNAGLYIDSDPGDVTHPFFATSNFEYPGTYDGSAAGGHGTEVLGMAASAGNGTCGICSGDAGEQGVAPGVGAVLESDEGEVPDTTASWPSRYLWAHGVSQTDPADSSNVLPGAAIPAEVATAEYGSMSTSDDLAQNQDIDAVIVKYGLSYTFAAGNDGPGGGTVGEPCDAYDTICVGGIDASSADHSLDQIASFSSRGPTPAGREKPDLVALADIDSTCIGWGTPSCGSPSPYLEVHDTGTSFSSPQAAGGAVLLASAGINSELERKALLIDSARQGRATPSSAMGTQTGWQPDWGWGELDLTDAYNQRANLATGRIPAANVAVYRADTGAAGDRATLVWNRRVDTDCPGDVYCGLPMTVHTLTNLSLFELDQTTLSQRAASTSTIDNVQQVRSPGADSVYYVVQAQQAPLDGIAAEPYAIAATNPLTALVSPTPGVSVQTSASAVRQGVPVTVTATVTNPSPDLALGTSSSHATATLTVPAGVSITQGSATQDLNGGVLGPCSAPNCPSQTTVQWTVAGNSDQIAQLQVGVSGAVLAPAFTDANTATASLTVDSAPPSVAISAPSGSQTTTAIPVSWSAQAQQGLSVSDYDVQVSVDGGPFVPWQTATTATSATYTGALGHSYRFQARASDQLGNTSAYTVSPTVAIADVCANDHARCAAPTVAITAPAGVQTAPTIPLSISASAQQAGQRIASYTIEVAGDGGPFAPYETFAQDGLSDPFGSDYLGRRGHSYRFEAQATDTLGTPSVWALSGTVTIADVCANDVARCPLASARLRVTHATLHRGTLTLQGTISSKARGRLQATITLHGHRTQRAKLTAVIRAGRFRLTVHAHHSAGTVASASWTLAFAGSRALAAARVSGTVRAR